MSDWTKDEMTFRHPDGTEMKAIPEKSLVTGLKVKEWDVLYRPLETGNLSRAGLPLMIPNFSSLAGDKTFKETGTQLPHHGFGRREKWSATEKSDLGFTCELTENETTMKIYPFKFKFSLRVTNMGNGTIKHETIIENTDTAKNLPVQPGLHPYFTCPQDQKAQLKMSVPASTFACDQWKWTTKEDTPDTNIDFDKRVEVTFPSVGKLELWEEPGQCPAGGSAKVYHYRKMQIWSEPQGAPDHHFVCFEPVTWGADGLNDPNTRLNVAPGKSVTLTMMVKATPSG